MWSFRVAWQGGQAEKSTYLFSVFCFLVHLLNWKVLTSFARPPPYIVQTTLPSVLQKSSSTESFSPSPVITSWKRDTLLFSLCGKMKRCNHTRWKRENWSMHFCCLPESQHLTFALSFFLHHCHYQGSNCQNKTM